jgi:Rod binding domain-containing protein
MNIDHPLPIQELTSLKTMSGITGKSQDTQDKIETFAQGFESVFISNLLDQMSATVDSFDEEKDGAAKQIDGIFRMQLAQNLSENGSLGLSKSIAQYVSHTLDQSRVSEPTEGQIL